MLRGWVLIALALAAGCVEEASPFARYEAASFVRADPFPILLVEIDHPRGRPPAKEAVDELLRVLDEVTAKREIRLAAYGEFARAEGGRSREDALRLLEASRSYETFGDQIVLHALYADSDCDEGEWDALGFENLREIVLCADRIDRLALVGPLVVPDPGSSTVERAVLIHETGHVLGLVDHGAPMVRPHKDPEHGPHSANRESVMYYAVESVTGLPGLIDDGQAPPYRFDADDLADLRALREGG